MRNLEDAVESLLNKIKSLDEEIVILKEKIKDNKRFLSSFQFLKDDEDYPSEDTEDTKEEGYVEK